MNKINNKSIKEQQKQLKETELEKVTGGFIPLYNDGVPVDNTKKETHKDGGATGGW